jgi:hypothetical protein
MKRMTLIAILGAALMGGGLVVAQTSPPQAKDEHAGHHPEKAAAEAPGKAKGPKRPASPEGGMGMKGGGMGMMGGDMGMMGGGMMCRGMAAGAKLAVTKLPNGVTMTFTSDDPKVTARLQKMAEGMRLMHEANEP